VTIVNDVCLLMSFFFNKNTNVFSMMNIAVVKNKDTLMAWIWIGKRNLNQMSMIAMPEDNHIPEVPART
jgi:hypothetical protein